MDHPLKKAMNKLEAIEQLIQQAIELSEFDVKYQPQEAIKAQVLADFIAKFTPTNDQQNNKGAPQWIVHVDGSSTQHVGGIGIILRSPKGDCLKYASRLQFQVTNNEAEYEALIMGLNLAKAMGVDSVVVHSDSQLVIGQVNGTCETKEERMKKYLNKVRNCIIAFMKVEFIQVLRGENAEAGSIARASSTEDIMDGKIEIRYIPNIDILEVQQVDGETNWTKIIVSYLRYGLLGS